MKTYQLIKFGMSDIGTVAAQDAIRKIDRDVRLSLKHADEAKAAADKARREYMATNPSDVKTAAKLQEEMHYYAAFARDQTAEIDKYIKAQMALFASKRLDPHRVYREAIIPTGETLPNGNQIFRIVKRETSLEPVEDADESRASVRAAVGYSERMGMSREVRRGKYNDAHLLIEQSTASVDPSEVVPFASACM